MSFATIAYEKKNDVASITLQRPHVLNVINIQMRDDLWEAITAARDDPEVEVILFRGAGDKAFSAGADLTEFSSAPSRAIAREARWQRDLWGLLLSLPQPTIAAVHGYTLGAGLELALCCDFRIASQDASFGLPEIGLGMIPAAAGTQTLPRVVKLGWALELLLLGERVSVDEAYRMGLVHQVVPREELLETALALAARLLGHEASAVKATKEAVLRGLDMRLAEGLQMERCLGLRLRQAQPSR